jgi:G3E family GTPase
MIPVTVLTGFLGGGKTMLLNRIPAGLSAIERHLDQVVTTYA